MMSAQMLASAGSVAGTVSDLAPGAKDGMRMLEARAVAMNKEEQMSTSVAPSAAGNEWILEYIIFKIFNVLDGRTFK